MGVASLILGIVSIIIGFIPFCGVIAFLPSITGFVLGLIDVILKSKRGEKKGISIAGLILSILAIIILFVYVFIIASGMFIYNSASNAVSSSLENITIEQNILSSISSSDTINNTESTPRCSVGESLTIDNMKVKFLSVNRDFKNYYKYATVKDGYKVIKADFELENVGSSSLLASSYHFSCYADGYACDAFYSAADSSFSSDLSSGKKVKGSVYFEVPTNAQNIEIEYDRTSWTDGKITFVVK